MIMGFKVLSAFYNKGYLAYDAVYVLDMGSGTRDRKIRRLAAMGMLKSKTYTNPDNGKKYKLFKITELGMLAYRKERIMRQGKNK